MTNNPNEININNAGKEQLLTLPGIGDALADRVIAARPFSSLDGLKDVEGIGETMFGQLKPLIKLGEGDDSENQARSELPKENTETTARTDSSDAPQGNGQEPQQLDTAGEDDETSTDLETLLPPEEDILIETKSDLAEAQQRDGGDAALGASAPEKVEISSKPMQDDKQDFPQKDSADPKKQGPKFITRGCAFWLMIGTTIVAVILSVIASLGILVAANGGLEYVSPREFMTLKRQVDGLTAQVNTLDSDLDDLYIRMENLESLSGRLGQLENSLVKVQKQVENADTKFEELSTTVGDLAGQIDELQTDTTRFRSFLEGLRKLLIGDASS
jgi:outer membrane murein-binding lipoprotein Lpp